VSASAVLRRSAVWVAIVVLAGALGLVAAGSASAASAGTIPNNGSGLCIGVHNSWPAGPAVQGFCVGTPTQTWHIKGWTYVGGQLGYQFQNAVGACLGVTQSSMVSGAAVVAGPCNSTDDHSQIWRYIDFLPGGPHGALVNGHSGLCMGITGSSYASGAAIIQGTCRENGSRTQSWNLQNL
jgi:galactose oxidase